MITRTMQMRGLMPALVVMAWATGLSAVGVGLALLLIWLAG